MASGNGVERRRNIAETAAYSREFTGSGFVPDPDLAYHCHHGQRAFMDIPGILGLALRPAPLFDDPH